MDSVYIDIDELRMYLSSYGDIDVGKDVVFLPQLLSENSNMLETENCLVVLNSAPNNTNSILVYRDRHLVKQFYFQTYIPNNDENEEAIITRILGKRKPLLGTFIKDLLVETSYTPYCLDVNDCDGNTNLILRDGENHYLPSIHAIPLIECMLFESLMKNKTSNEILFSIFKQYTTTGSKLTCSTDGMFQIDIRYNNLLTPRERCEDFALHLKSEMEKRRCKLGKYKSSISFETEVSTALSNVTLSIRIPYETQYLRILRLLFFTDKCIPGNELRNDMGTPSVHVFKV